MASATEATGAAVTATLTTINRMTVTRIHHARLAPQTVRNIPPRQTGAPLMRIPLEVAMIQTVNANEVGAGESNQKHGRSER